MPSESTLTGSTGIYVSVALIVGYGLIVWAVVVRQGLIGSLNCIVDRRKRPPRGLSLLYWGSPILFAALWGLASYSGLASSRTVPTPGEFGHSFLGLTISGTLPAEALISFKRVVLGFSAAALVAVPLGLLGGAFVVGKSVVVPTNSFLRYIPPTAFIALLIVYCGVGEEFKYAVVFLGVVFFIGQMVVDVVDDMDVRYVEIALTSGLSNTEVFRRIIAPSCWPRIFDVLRINLSAAWTFLVAAELIGAERGLGHFIAVSQRFLRLGDLYSGIVTFGIIGLLTDFALERLSRKLFRWYYISLKRSTETQMLPIPRDIARYRELAPFIEDPKKLEAASEASLQRLIDGCISRLEAVQMGGRSASLVGLSVILWVVSRRRRVTFPVVKLLSLCLKIAKDPSFIQPEWAVVLAGVLIARYPSDIVLGAREEIVNQSRQQLRDIRDDPALPKPVHMAATSLLEEWDLKFKSGLDPVVQCCLRGWPDTTSVRSISQTELNEIIQIMNETLPGSLSDKDRIFYRLNLERNGDWKLLESIRMR